MDGGEEIDLWNDALTLGGETVLGGLMYNVAGKVIPRGPGREPIKFGSSLTGKVGSNVLWNQGYVQNVGYWTGKNIWNGLTSQ